jgi:hypothetical protein
MSPRFRFLVNRVSIGNDLESASPRGNHLDFRIGEALANLSRQTGGSRLVVSNNAVFDADLHWPVIGGGFY